MDHYVCVGECGGVSDQAKACDAENCSRKDQQMANCRCVDDSHQDVKTTKPE